MTETTSAGDGNLTQTDVSVIIVNFNTFELTCRCLDSIYHQTSGLLFEIILVDNASSECDAGLFKDKFPEITLVRNTINTGFAKGNNAGIRQAKGAYILLLNSDTVLMNNAIKIAYDRLYSDERLAIVSVKLVFPDGRVQKQCERFPSVTLNLLERFRLHKLLPSRLRSNLLLGPYFDHESYQEPDCVWGTFFMFKSKLLKLLPGQQLNDEYFMYYEDTQWCMDFKKLGYRIAYDPAGRVMHDMGKSNAPRSELIQWSKTHFYRKNFSKLKAAFLNRVT